MSEEQSAMIQEEWERQQARRGELMQLRGWSIDRAIETAKLSKSDITPKDIIEYAKVFIDFIDFVDFEASDE